MLNQIFLLFTSLFMVIGVECYLNEYVRYFETLDYNNDEIMDSHYRLRRSQLTHGNSLKLSFVAFQTTFDLSLQPDSEHTDYELFVNGKPRSKHLANSLYYTGYDASDPYGTYVHGNLAFGVFEGTIHGRDEVYYIEPSNRYFNNVSHHSVIYRQSDAISESIGDHGLFCGVKNTRMKRASSPDALIYPRQDDIDKTKQKCDLKVLIDEQFYREVTDNRNTEAFRVAQAIAIVKDIILAGSKNFKKTDFDNDGNPDGIHFAIHRFEVLTNNSKSNLPIANPFMGVDALLTAFSKDDYSDYCLSYLFTYREFEKGVLGLAYVAAAGSSGGICDKPRKSDDGRFTTYNTGLVTLSNYNRRVSRLVTHVTFTHEAGHNFGSNHDPESCTNRDGNNYVMFSQASTGTKSNNNQFSKCSISEMKLIIQDKGQSSSGCFKQTGDNCGNLLADPNEDCDCGTDFDTRTGVCNDDPCCNGTSCRLVNDAECSPQQGPCCNDTCQLIPLFDDVICSEGTDCSYNQTCNGSSATCPAPDPIEPLAFDEYGIPCNDGRNYCVEVECTGSLCVPLQLSDCECKEEQYLCHVCCKLANGTCVSTIALSEQNKTAKSILPDGMGATVGVGYPCNVSQGYCDFYNVCRLVDNEGPLRRLTNLLKGILNASQLFSLNYIQQYWWAYVVAMAVMILVVFSLVLINHKLIKRPKHMQEKMNRQMMQRPRRIKVHPMRQDTFL